MLSFRYPTLRSNCNFIANASSKKKKIIKGPTRIRTRVVRIRTESDNHYTIGPDIVKNDFWTPPYQNAISI